MLKGFLNAVLRVLAGTLFVLVLAATVGIPAGKRGPAAAEPGGPPPPALEDSAKDVCDPLPHVTREALWASVTPGRHEFSDLRMEDTGRLLMQPDACRLAYVAGGSEAEIWVMENFLPKIATAR